MRPAPGPWARATAVKEQKSARDRKVFFEVEQLIGRAEFGVKQRRGERAEAGQQQRGDPGRQPADDRQASTEFERDRRRRRLDQDAIWLSVTNHPVISPDFHPGFMREQRSRHTPAQRQAGGRGMVNCLWARARLLP